MDRWWTGGAGLRGWRLGVASVRVGQRRSSPGSTWVTTTARAWSGSDRTSDGDGLTTWLATRRPSQMAAVRACVVGIEHGSQHRSDQLAGGDQQHRRDDRGATSRSNSVGSCSRRKLSASCSREERRRQPQGEREPVGTVLDAVEADLQGRHEPPDLGHRRGLGDRGLPAGEEPVDGGPGHAGLAGDVLDRGLGEAPAAHADQQRRRRCGPRSTRWRSAATTGLTDRRWTPAGVVRATVIVSRRHDRRCAPCDRDHRRGQ